MTAVVLVPVKEHSRAKSRLSPIMTHEERSTLARAMFEDVIKALQPLSCRVALTTNSRCAAVRAGQLGWQVIWEQNQVSESASVDAASRQLALEGASAVLRLPADVPLAQTCDVIEILEMPLVAPAAILVPSRDGTGTNALLRTPPALFSSHFGPGSFALHIRAAQELGVRCQVVENPRLALDIDDPSDIVRLLALAGDGETCNVLLEMNIRERLAYHARQQDLHLGSDGNT